MMPLFNLALPANAGIFFGLLMKIASFDIIPTDIFFNEVLSWVSTDPVNNNFNSVGFGSTLFIYNIGSMIILYCAYPVFVLVYLMICYCYKSKDKNPCRLKTKEKLRNCLFWGQPIVIITEGFGIISMCTFINLKFVSLSTLIYFQISWDRPEFYISSLLTLFFLFLICSMPILLVLILLVNWRRLHDKDFK